MKIVAKTKSLIPVVVVVLVAGLVYVLWPGITRAVENQQDIPWTNGKPVVLESSTITDVALSGSCPNSIEQKNILEGVSVVTNEVCMTEGKQFRYGTYFTGNAYVPIVSFGFDNMAYRITGTSCGEPGTCVYLSATDTLAVRMPVNPSFFTLEIYKNFSKRVKRDLRGPLPLTAYVFDAPEPDYVFKKNDGTKWPVGGIGGSPNGKYIALEIKQRGIAILDTETFEMRRISSLFYQYNFGAIPWTELAITNDGFHVAVTGLNAYLYVFDTYPNCGDEATELRIQELIRIERPCPIAYLPFDSIIEHFKYGLHPKFTDDGGILQLYALSYTIDPRLVYIRAPGYIVPIMDYIALGDSFSSGEGETDDSYYLRGTNDTFEKCHISSRSYPFLLARSMRIDTEAMRSVACSGAKTNDVIGADKAYIGQDNRFGIDKLNISFDAISIAQTYASEHFMPGRIHQERFISRTHPKIATISIGGNDIFLFRKLQPCLSYGTCTLAGTPKGREQTALEIRSLFTTLVNTYTELRNTSPQTELYVVGYPKIIDPNGICSGILGQLLDPAEKRYMDETISYINQVISAAAKKVGVRYIDISDAFGDQRLCGSTTSSAMNGIRLGDDSVPVGPFNLIGAESFHPNPKGNVMITNTIINSVGNLFNHRYCASGVVFCQTDVTVPEPSSYWLPDGITHGYSSLQSRDFMHDTPSDKYDKIISLPANSLQPGSTVRVEVHSNPTVLADTSAKDDGSLDLTVRLPTNLEQGFHTLYLYGTTYSGEQVDFYQIFQHSQNVTTTPQSPQSADMTTHPTVSSVSIKNESDSVASVQTSSNPINTGVVLGESDTKNTAPPSIWPYYLSATSLLIVVLSILIRRYIKRHCGSS